MYLRVSNISTALCRMQRNCMEYCINLWSKFMDLQQGCIMHAQGCIMHAQGCIMHAQGFIMHAQICIKLCMHRLV